MNKDMENLKFAFDVLEDGTKIPADYHKTSTHLVFEALMNIEHKSLWVKVMHKVSEPGWSAFYDVVPRESTRISLTYDALNNLPACACDIQTDYLQEPSSEKHYAVSEPEFGLKNAGELLIIVRALYGGKYAGAGYCSHSRSAMEGMLFSSCKYDADAWLRAALKTNGVECYQHVLLGADYVLDVMEEPERFLREVIGNRFTLKEKYIGALINVLAIKYLKLR